MGGKKRNKKTKGGRGGGKYCESFTSPSPTTDKAAKKENQENQLGSSSTSPPSTTGKPPVVGKDNQLGSSSTSPPSNTDKPPVVENENQLGSSSTCPPINTDKPPPEESEENKNNLESPSTPPPPKCIYFPMHLRKLSMQWYLISPRDEICKVFGMELHRKTRLHHFASAVSGSKIFILGGLCLAEYHEVSPSLHKKVFVYDQTTDTVEALRDMNAARADHVAVVIGGKIYVFGYRRYGSNKHILNINQWAEFYDPENKTWNEVRDVPNQVYQWGHIDGLAVNESQMTIYLLKSTKGVSSYNYKTGEWKDTDLGGISLNIPWSNGNAIVGNYFFWHFKGEIYAYDLVGHTMFEHTLKVPHTTAHTLTPYNCRMIYLGNDWFCVLHLDSKSYLHCCKFRIKFVNGQPVCVVGRDTPMFYLGPQNHGIFDAITL